MNLFVHSRQRASKFTWKSSHAFECSPWFHRWSRWSSHRWLTACPRRTGCLSIRWAHVRRPTGENSFEIVHRSFSREDLWRTDRARFYWSRNGQWCSWRIEPRNRSDDRTSGTDRCLWCTAVTYVCSLGTSIAGCRIEREDMHHERHDQTSNRIPRENIDQWPESTLSPEADHRLELEFGELENSSELCEDVEAVHREWLDQFDSVERTVWLRVVHRRSIPSIAMEFQQCPSDTEYPRHADNVYEPMLNA